MENIDTVEGIRGYLGTLASLWELADKRQAAKDSASLHHFVCNGKWSLDRHGQLFTITHAYFPSEIEDESFSAQFLADVIELEDLKRVLPTLALTVEGRSPPRPDAVCRHCGRGWTIEDAHVALRQRDEGAQAVWSHPDCRQRYLAKEERRVFEGVLRELGVMDPDLSETPNEYNRSPTSTPWFVIHLPPHGTIKIGWRRSGVHLDWGGLPENITGLFDEGVKEPRSIDTKGLDDMKSYLQRIVQRLGVK